MSVATRRVLAVSCSAVMLGFLAWQTDWSSLGWTYMCHGRTDSAIHAYRMAGKLGDTDAYGIVKQIEHYRRKLALKQAHCLPSDAGHAAR